MVYAEIGIGATWIVFGALMVWAGLFDRTLVPGAVWRVLGVPFAILGAIGWVVRMGLRAGFGTGSRKAKASR